MVTSKDPGLVCLTPPQVLGWSALSAITLLLASLFQGAVSKSIAQPVRATQTGCAQRGMLSGISISQEASGTGDPTQLRQLDRIPGLPGARRRRTMVVRSAATAALADGTTCGRGFSSLSGPNE